MSSGEPKNGKIDTLQGVNQLVKWSSWWSRRKRRRTRSKRKMSLDFEGPDLNNTQFIYIYFKNINGDSKYFIFDVDALGLKGMKALESIWGSSTQKYTYGGTEKSKPLEEKYGIKIKYMNDVKVIFEKSTGKKNTSFSNYIKFIYPDCDVSVLKKNGKCLDYNSIQTKKLVMLLYSSISMLNNLQSININAAAENKKNNHTPQTLITSQHSTDESRLSVAVSRRGRDRSRGRTQGLRGGVRTDGDFQEPELELHSPEFLTDTANREKNAETVMERKFNVGDCVQAKTNFWIGSKNRIQVKKNEKITIQKIDAHGNLLIQIINNPEAKTHWVRKLNIEKYLVKIQQNLQANINPNETLIEDIPSIDRDLNWNKILKKTWKQTKSEEKVEINFDANSQLIPAKMLEGIPKCSRVFIHQEENGILFDHLPSEFTARLRSELDWSNVREIILDRGHPPYAYFCNQKRRVFIGRDKLYRVDDYLLQQASKNLHFGLDNRACLENSLHRVVNIKSPKGDMCCLVFRFGRQMDNLATFAEDILFSPENENKSILVLGPPGTGKTSMIRAMAKQLDDINGENVIIVDTSNEICGGGEMVHKSLGLCRRMVVKNKTNQDKIMIEAVQNLTPDTIVIDEIGTKSEVQAAKTIKYRGPRIIASAHGSFRDLLSNPSLNPIFGHFENIIYGDKTIPKNSNGKKLQVKRTGRPVFDIIIELVPQEFNEWKIISNVGEAVDDILNGKLVIKELRSRDTEGNLFLQFVEE